MGLDDFDSSAGAKALRGLRAQQAREATRHSTETERRNAAWRAFKANLFPLFEEAVRRGMPLEEKKVKKSVDGWFTQRHHFHTFRRKTLGFRDDYNERSFYICIYESGEVNSDSYSSIHYEWKDKHPRIIEDGIGFQYSEHRGTPSGFYVSVGQETVDLLELTAGLLRDAMPR